MDSLLSAATVGSTHGLKGYLKVYSLSGEYDHLCALDECTLRLKDGAERAVRVEEARFSGSLFLMKFVSYDTPEKARSLTGSTILIRRDQASPLEEGELYVADLYGLEVISEGRRAGVVESTSEGAQALYLHVRTENGIRLVPYLPVYIGKVDAENGTIEVLMPELLA